MLFFLLVWMLALLTYFSLNYLLHYFMISFRTYILPGLRVYLLVSYLLTSCFHVILTYFLTSWFHSLLSYFLTSWLPDFAACLFEYFLILYLHTRLQDFNYAFAYDFATSITGLLITVRPHWWLYLQRLRLYRRFHIWLWIYVRLYSFIYDYAYDFAVQMRSIWSYCVKLLENM